ncbi:uncharacterized protein LOC108157087 isoform X3 [Drosophila miranda]|uniref:uncharacterized protein LOC108157087 isoform X3 n=1 Tax=Drosophila miranda TaxID=7229 RepID=UPI00143F7288|nr:uncharacterized protein LOC108157087 isoform X3 [Drosophila miranda]
MKTHLVLAIALCWFPLLSLAEDEIISSANMSTFAIALRLLDPRNLMCFISWLDKLVKKAPALTREVVDCSIGLADLEYKILSALEKLVTIAGQVVFACAGLVLNAVIGGISCVKGVAIQILDLVAVMKRFQEEISSGEHENAVQCVKESFKKFFEVSSVFEIVDACFFPNNSTS